MPSIQGRHLVIGLGEVGKALLEVLESQDVTGIDKDQNAVGHFDVIHICIPYSDKFVSIVQDYIEQYGTWDALVINHSSVPIGTTDKFDGVHSPIRGVHPNLAKGIKTFVKYFGGRGGERAAEYFTTLGIKTHVVASARDTEALKLWDTTYYGWNIVFEKMLKEYCERENLDFDLVYTHANLTYNKGYTELEMENVVRPVLRHMDGKIGGHCVIPNATILKEEEIAQFILQYNSKVN